MQDSQKSKLRWIIVSFVLSVVLLAVKFGAYYITHSNAILSDALESIINVIASGFAFYSVYLSAKPRDKDHPYGHGKIEYFSSGFEGGLIVVAGMLIVWEAIQRLRFPRPVEHLDWGILLIFITVLLNGGLGYYLTRLGERTRSEALRADGHHLLTDSLSSVLILVGLGILWLTGWSWIDSAFSLLLSLVIFYNGFLLIRRAVAALMDETDPELLNEIVETLKAQKHPEWIDVHNMRVQKYGSDLHIDCHLTLPFYWDLKKAHDTVHDFEEILKRNTTGEVEIFIHADPCLPDCCHYCRMDCPFRFSAFEKDVQWSAHNLSENQKHFVKD
ncbi:MAG: cation diffusion facilitator family transporter [Spirosomaceae bacterium]|nr:cation diffusion facilitator family transporter [Spirosomataceae bacterium]